MIESLQTTQIAFFRFATPSGFLGGWGGGRRRGTKSIRARDRARENPMKPFVRTSFLGTRPSCPPSPGRPFFCTDFLTEPHRQPRKQLIDLSHNWMKIRTMVDYTSRVYADQQWIDRLLAKLIKIWDSLPWLITDNWSVVQTYDRFFSIVEMMSTRVHSKDIKRSRKQNDR